MIALLVFAAAAAADPAAIEQLVTCPSTPAAPCPVAHISALLLFLGCGLLAASVPDLLRRRSLVDPSRTSVAGALLVIAAVLPPLGWTWLLLVPVVVLARVGMVPSARARLARDPTMWLALAVALLLAPWT